MQRFVAKHAEHVIGTLSGFDRLVFRGTMRALCSRSGLMSYLWGASPVDGFRRARPEADRAAQGCLIVAGPAERTAGVRPDLGRQQQRGYRSPDCRGRPHRRRVDLRADRG